MMRKYFLSQATLMVVRKFVITDTDENGENLYMTNNNQFTVIIRTYCRIVMLYKENLTNYKKRLEKKL